MLRVEIIKQIPLFGGASDAQLEALARAAELVGLDGVAETTNERLPAGHKLFDAGEPVDGVYFALDLRKRPVPTPIFVRLEIPVPPPGKPMRLERVDEGKLFGESEFLQAGLSASARKRDTRAVLITAAHVVRVPIAAFAKLLDEAPRVRQKTIALSAKRLKDALQSQLRGRNLDGDANLADHLMRLAEDFGRYVGNYAVFSEKVSQTDIAADLGIGRRALTDRLQAWAEGGLIRTTPLTLLDVRRIEQLRKVGTEEPASLIAETARKIEQMTDAGDLHAARSMAIEIGKFFPSSPLLTFRGALAAARSGRREDAEAILEAAELLDASPEVLAKRVLFGLAKPEAAVVERLPEGPDFDDLVSDAIARTDDDEAGALAAMKREANFWTREILSLRGRLAKDKALASGIAGDAEGAAERYLETEQFEVRADAFPAINAASMSLLAGNDARARAIAERVISEIRPEDYWGYTSLAEAQLIAGRAELAKAAALKAMDAPHRDGMVASTRRQLRRLMPVLGPATQEVLDELRVRRPMIYSGTLILPGQFDDPEAVEAHIKGAVEDYLKADEIAAAFGALAQGSDIIIAEAVLEAGIELHVVLPFGDDEFIAQSVALGPNAESWTARFNDIINRCTSVSIAQPGVPLARDLDMSFRHGFRLAGALAAERAAFLETEPLLLAIAAAGPTGALAGTSADIADWESFGREAVKLALPFERHKRSGTTQSKHGFSAVVFCFPRDAEGSEAEARLADVVEELGLTDCKILPRRIKGGHNGAVATVSDVATALRLGFAVFDRGKGDGRVICDFGPVFGRSGAPDIESLARMAGAADLAGFPTDRVLASASLAAEVIFARLPGVEAIATGQRAFRATERGRLRIMPTSGVYELVRETPPKKPRRPKS